jgi:hypothetical protein
VRLWKAEASQDVIGKRFADAESALDRYRRC